MQTETGMKIFGSTNNNASKSKPSATVVSGALEEDATPRTGKRSFSTENPPETDTSVFLLPTPSRNKLSRSGIFHRHRPRVSSEFQGKNFI